MGLLTVFQKNTQALILLELKISLFEKKKKNNAVIVKFQFLTEVKQINLKHVQILISRRRALWCGVPVVKFESGANSNSFVLFQIGTRSFKSSSARGENGNQ